MALQRERKKIQANKRVRAAIWKMGNQIYSKKKRSFEIELDIYFKLSRKFVADQQLNRFFQANNISLQHFARDSHIDTYRFI